MKKLANRFERFDYKWVIVGVSFLMVFTALGFCSSAKNIFLKPTCEALEMSRSAYSLYETFRHVTTAIANIFFGTLIAKFGMKKLIFAGFASLITANVIFAFTNGIWGFYIGGIFLGLGFAWTTTTMVGAVVSKWCAHNKGTIMGVILASNGIGATVAVQILSPILSSDTFGFRTAYRLIAIILLAVGAVVLLLFKDKPWHTFPDSHKDSESASKKEKKTRSSWSGIAYSDALKKSYFYCALICVFFTSLIQQGSVAIPHFQDLQFSDEWVSFIVSFYFVLLSVTKILSGFLYDRLGLRFIVTFSYICSIITQILLLTITNSPLGTSLTVLYCFTYAIALPLDTVMIPIMTGDLFGEKSYAKLLGILAAAGTLGGAVGSPIANACYDIFGSYTVVFYVGLAIIVAATVLMQFVISRANKEKAKAEITTL